MYLLQKVVTSADFGSLDTAVRSEGIHGIVGDSKDFWLFFKRNDCTIDGDLRMFAGLVRLRGKQSNLRKQPGPVLGRTAVIRGHTY